jgi:hypothetical protein
MLSSHRKEVPTPDHDARRRSTCQPPVGNCNGFLVSVDPDQMRLREAQPLRFKSGGQQQFTVTTCGVQDDADVLSDPRESPAGHEAGQPGGRVVDPVAFPGWVTPDERRLLGIQHEGRLCHVPETVRQHPDRTAAAPPWPCSAFAAAQGR